MITKRCRQRLTSADNEDNSDGDQEDSHGFFVRYLVPISKTVVHHDHITLICTFLDTMHLCHGPGPLCPSPPCGIGPRHHEWECDTSSTSSSSSSSTETSYENTDEADETDNNRNGQSGTDTPGGFSKFSAMMYVIAGAALALIVGGVLFKKRVSYRVLIAVYVLDTND
jgi:hypothetical protein